MEPGSGAYYEGEGWDCPEEMKVAAIINPAAGGIGGSSGQQRIISSIEKVYPGTKILLTTKAGDEQRLGQEAATGGYDLLMVLGGDGTLNGAANGLLSSGVSAGSLPVVAPLPFGTGGDFARGLGYPARSVDHIDKLTSLKQVNIDAGKLSFVGLPGAKDRYWLNQSYIGIGAHVVERVNRSGKVSGSSAYTIASISEVLRYKVYDLEIADAGGKPQQRRVVNVLVANGRYSGGGMLTAPSASPSDGSFEASIVDREAIVGAFPRLKLLKNLSKFKDGSYLALKGVTHFGTKGLTISGDPSEIVEADGEVVGSLPVLYSLLPSALKVLEFRGSDLP